MFSFEILGLPYSLVFILTCGYVSKFVYYAEKFFLCAHHLFSYILRLIFTLDTYLPVLPDATRTE